MTDYGIRLGCCGRIIRLRLPRDVSLYEATITCEKQACKDSLDEFTLVLHPYEWQDESRTYTTGERSLDDKIDYQPARRKAAA